MRHTLLGASFAIGAALAAITVAATPAHADTGDTALLNDLHAAGFMNNNGNSKLITDAHKVCTYLATTNHDGEDIAQQIYLNSSLDDITMARLFVLIAVDDLCPQFNHNNDSSSAAAHTERT